MKFFVFVSLVALSLVGAGVEASALTVKKSDVEKYSKGVSTRQAQVSGKIVTVLTDVNGMSLYTFTKDSPGHSNCSGACLSEWPTLVPLSAAPAPFGTIKGNNGQPQVTLNGLPLYHYDDDKHPGDAFGNYPQWSSVIVTE